MFLSKRPKTKGYETMMYICLNEKFKKAAALYSQSKQSGSRHTLNQPGQRWMALT